MKDADFTTLRRVLAANLRNERLKQSMSQDALAEASGLSQKTISQIESATFATTIDTMQRLAVALRIKTAQLLLEG